MRLCLGAIHRAMRSSRVVGFALLFVFFFVPVRFFTFHVSIEIARLALDVRWKWLAHKHGVHALSRMGKSGEHYMLAMTLVLASAGRWTLLPIMRPERERMNEIYVSLVSRLSHAKRKRESYLARRLTHACALLAVAEYEIMVVIPEHWFQPVSELCDARDVAHGRVREARALASSIHEEEFERAVRTFAPFARSALR